jgi:TPR repeat protein
MTKIEKKEANKILHIYVKDLAGNIYLTEPNKDCLILTIKGMVEDMKKEYELDCQELFIQNEKNDPIILDDYNHLSDYGLSHQSMVYIFIRPPLWKRMEEAIMKGTYILTEERDQRFGDRDSRYEKLFVAYRNSLLTPDEPDSQCIIGLAYFYGHGIYSLDYISEEIAPRLDRIKAVEWFEKAVEKNHIASSYFLGECLFYGIGTEMNISRGCDLIHFAADQEFIAAQLLLAEYYTENMGGIYRDVAKLWLRRAAKNGSMEAKKLLKTF